MMKVSVILPTLNERDNIIALVDNIYEAVPDVHEVIVVDDDSTDGTPEAVRGYARERPARRVRVEVRTSDHGLTKSIAHGVAVATGDVVVWMDCDLSMPAAHIPKLLAGIDEGYDAVIGSRFVHGGSFKTGTSGTQDSALAVALSRVMNHAIQLLLDHRFKDYTSGFIAAKRAMVLDLGFRGDYGEYFIDLMFRAIRRGYLLLETPYVCLPRLHGISKTGTNIVQYLRRGRGYIIMALSLRILALRRETAGRRAFPATQPAVDAIVADVRLMEHDDVAFVAGLHHRLLFDTLNSRLGIPFLERLYGALLEDPLARCWVGLSDGKHVAFVSATRDLHATDARVVSRVPFRDRIVAVLHIATNVRDLRAFLSHRMLLPYVRVRFGSRFPTILTLGVSEAMWGTGLAQRLVDQVHAHFSLLGEHRYHVDTRTDNMRAAAFYRKVGFERVGTIAGTLIFCRSTAAS